MFWRFLLKIGMDILASLIVEFVVFTIRSFFASYSKAHPLSFA